MNTKGTSGNESSMIVHDQISLRSLVRSLTFWYNYFRSKRKAIILYTGVGAILGVAVAFIIPTEYVAATSFVLENTKRGGMSEYASVAAKFGLTSGSGGGLFQDDENIMAFIRSRTLISKALYSPLSENENNELLIERYAKVYGFTDKWKGDERLSALKFHADPGQRTIQEDSIVSIIHKQILKKNLTVVKPDEDESIIVVAVRAIDEQFSKAFNENLLKNVIEFYVESQTKRATENVDILSYQVDSIRRVLDAALYGIAENTDANPNMNPGLQRLKLTSQKKMVDVEMSKAILSELVKNLELSKITLRKETPLVQIIDSPVLPLDKKKLSLKLSLVVGAIAGFCFSLLLLSIRSFWQKALASE